MARVPHPVRPKPPIWLPGTLILWSIEIYSYQIANLGHLGHGFPPATPDFKKLMFVIAISGSIKFKKNRLNPDRRSVVKKK